MNGTVKVADPGPTLTPFERNVLLACQALQAARTFPSGRAIRRQLERGEAGYLGKVRDRLVALGFLTLTTTPWLNRMGRGPAPETVADRPAPASAEAAMVVGGTAILPILDPTVELSAMGYDLARHHLSLPAECTCGRALGLERYAGTPYGLEGDLCRECRDDFYHEMMSRRVASIRGGLRHAYTTPKPRHAG